MHWRATSHDPEFASARARRPARLRCPPARGPKLRGWDALRPGRFRRAGPALCLLGLCLLAVVAAGRLAAAEGDEARAREVLVKMFLDGLHEYVEREAAAFASQFPHSTNLAEVVLLRAQARLALGRHDDAIKLLESDAALVAGPLAAEYAFWAAEARFRKGDFAAAAAGFAAMAARHPESPRRLEAAVQEALARSRAGDPAQAGARLRDPDGPFQTAARANPGSPWASRGWLLLAQLLVSLNDADGARQALTEMARQPLPPPMEWERRLVLARAEFTAGRLAEAVGQTTNLWTAVTNSLPPALIAEAAALEGRAFEGLQQYVPALQAYERGLATNAPPAPRRLALEKVIEITRQAVPDQAVTRLQQFIDRFPQDELLDLARFALGQALLREFYRLSDPATPVTPETSAARTLRLQQARAQFELLVSNHPASPLLPQAELARAWTLWEEGAPRLADALAAFRNATSRLAPGVDQATARLQWAECQFRSDEWAGALTNFWLVATNYLDAAIPPTLRSQGLFGVVRTGIAAGDLAAAAAAADRLVQMEGAAEVSERADILLAEAYSRAGQPEQARAQYEAFLQRHPDSRRTPEVRLAIARTFEQRGDNGAALSAYASWLANFTNQPAATNLVAQATFDLARVTHRVDPGPGSLTLLTNFIARFPDDPNAPLAQYLVAEQLFNQGDFAPAELAFLDKLLDPARARPGDELPYRARLMAGKCAVYRSGWQSAREHFDWLITNGPLSVVSSRVPVSVVAEAYIFRGDLFMLEPKPPGSDPLAGYAEAINAFAKVAERFPTNELAPLAWGRIGDCNLQLATADPRRYDAAAEAYQKVIESSAGPRLRSMAEVGLGLVLKKQAALKPAAEQPALFDEAMTHFLNVLYGRNLQPGEAPDPPWVRQAGLEAAELAESLRQWDAAIGLYQRLITELPPLKPRLERKIEDLRRVAAATSGTQ